MNLLLNYILPMVLVVFEGYVIFRYMTIFFGNRFKNTKLSMIAYGVCVITSFVIGRGDFYPVIGALISFSAIFIISVSYEGSLSKHIMVTVMIYMCLFAAEAVVAVFVGLSGVEPLGKMQQGSIFINFVVKFIAWLISFVISRFKNVDDNQKLPKFFVFTIGLIPIALICLVGIVFSQGNLSDEKRTVALICFTIVLLIIIYLYDSLEVIFRDRTQAALMTREKEYYHQQSLLLQDKYDELRRYRHDMINRLVVIRQLLKKENYEEAIRYTGKIEEKLEATKMRICTGNVALDSVVNYKLGKAQMNDLTIETDFTIPEKLPVDEDDMVVLTGNLLDNAIEAVGRMDFGNSKYIYMSMSFDMGMIWSCIKNSYSGKMKIDGSTPKTSKQDKAMHGIGLTSVRKITEKYNGLLDIYTEDGLFVVDVVLHI